MQELLLKMGGERLRRGGRIRGILRYLTDLDARTGECEFINSIKFCVN